MPDTSITSATQATRVRHERHERDTSETWVLHKRHEYDTSTTRMTQVKYFDFDNSTNENIFSHPYIHSKNYLLEMPRNIFKTTKVTKLNKATVKSSDRVLQEPSYLISCMIFGEKHFSGYILLNDQISLSGCFYFVRY